MKTPADSAPDAAESTQALPSESRPTKNRTSVTWRRRFGAVRTWLDVVTTLAILGAASAIIWSKGIPSMTRTPERSEITKGIVSLEGAALKGSPNARTAMIIYSDFQCPFCAKFARETLPILQKRYVEPGRLRLAFRHFPLSNHRHAEKAAQSAECAGAQGQFWPMHDALFETQEDLAQAVLVSSAGRLGLDLSRFTACLTSADGVAQTRVKLDVDSARVLRIRATPSFLFGDIQPDGGLRVTETLSGAAPVSEFVTLIDRVITSESRR